MTVTGHISALLQWAGRNGVGPGAQEEISSEPLREPKSIHAVETALGLRMGLRGRVRLMLFAQRLGRVGPQGASNFELLLRLQHGDAATEPLAAINFLKAAEEMGFMVMLDRWVLQEALLRRGGAIERSGIGVSINVCAQSLNDPAFLPFFLGVMEQTPIPAERLLLEITEHALVKDLAVARATLEQVRSLGCRIALDDFGVGTSSFDYLRSLPVDYLKIDGSFARGMLHSRVEMGIVRGMQHLARELDIRTVMEHVETPALLDMAQELGVDFAQGHAVSRPEPLEDVLLRLLPLDAAAAWTF